MAFGNPSFLYALFALAIPIVIHLFYFRTRQTVYFSSIIFLKNIQTQTASRSKLKHLLTLIARMIAIAALVFTFARPYIPSNDEKQGNAAYFTGIYIDNSFSMEAEGKYGKLLDEAKKNAVRIADAYPNGTRFRLITDEFSGIHSKPVTKEDFISHVGKIETQSRSKNINEIVEKFKNSIHDNSISGNAVLYIISDFQKPFFNISTLKPDSDLKIVLVPLENPLKKNVYIDSLWFENPEHKIDMPDEVYFSLVNTSQTEAAEVPVKLFINDTLKIPTGISLKAGERKTEKLTYTNKTGGIISGRIEISDFPVVFDNTFHFSYDISKKRKILVVSEQEHSKYIELLFDGNPYFELTMRKPFNIKNSELADYDVLILDQIKTINDDISRNAVSFINNGGTCFIISPTNPDYASYNKFLEKMNGFSISGKDSLSVSYKKINENDPLFKNVFIKNDENLELPFTKSHLKINNLSLKTAIEVISAENNDPILLKSEYGSGTYYFLTHSLDEKHSNLVFHPLWTPILYNIAVSENNTDDVYRIIGKNKKIRVKPENFSNDNVVRIKNEALKIDFIPLLRRSENGNEVDVFPEENIIRSGVYTIHIGDEPLQGIAFNYSSDESRTDYFSEKELTDVIEEKAQTNISLGKINEQTNAASLIPFGNRKDLSVYFLLSALFFIMLEILLIRIIRM